MTTQKLASIISRQVIDALKSEGLVKSHSDKITRKEVRQRYHISEPTILKYEKEGKIKGYRLGRRVLFSVKELDAALTPRKFVRDE